MRQLDESVAHEVAARFLAAPSQPDDPVIERAYRLLELESDRMFVALTQGETPPVRVVFTRCREPYASDVEMIDAVRSTRLLEVVACVAERDRPHPVMGNEVGGGYDRFRAVHDLVGHVRHGFGFDRQGEYAAWLAQDEMHSPLARQALATELHAEHSVRWTTGAVAEHKATLLDAELIARARHGTDSSACASLDPPTTISG